MAGRLETLAGDAWRGLVAAPVAVLTIGKRDCEACARWSEELERFLATDREWTETRFGKIVLDAGGLADFKRANPWLAAVDDLPFTRIYVGGEAVRSFAGGGLERLLGRLRTVAAPPGRPPPARPAPG